MDAVWGHDEAQHLRPLPALEVLRCVGLQPSDRCTAPGLEEGHWRGPPERPPSALLLQSPYDLEARDGPKRDTEWGGYTTHVSATCAEGSPDLFTPVWTTLATTPAWVMGPAMPHDGAQRALLPGTPWVDTG
jgi:transposase